MADCLYCNDSGLRGNDSICLCQNGRRLRRVLIAIAKGEPVGLRDTVPEFVVDGCEPSAIIVPVTFQRR